MSGISAVDVSSTASHSRPNRRGGSRNASSSVSPFTSTTNDESTAASVERALLPVQKHAEVAEIAVLPVALRHRTSVRDRTHHQASGSADSVGAPSRNRSCAGTPHAHYEA